MHSYPLAVVSKNEVRNLHNSGELEFVGILYLGSLLWYGEMSEGDCMFFYAANEGEEKRGVL